MFLTIVSYLGAISSFIAFICAFYKLIKKLDNINENVKEIPELKKDIKKIQEERFILTKWFVNNSLPKSHSFQSLVLY